MHAIIQLVIKLAKRTLKDISKKLQRHKYTQLNIMYNTNIMIKNQWSIKIRYMLHQVEKYCRGMKNKTTKKLR